MTKTCWGNIGNLFVICMQQVTKGHLYHLFGVSDYYVMYIGRGQSLFCETSVKVTKWVIDPFRWLCELLWKSLWLEGENVDVSPKWLNTLPHDIYAGSVL